MMTFLIVLVFIYVVGAAAIYWLLADKPSDIKHVDVFMPMLMWPLVVIAVVIAFFLPKEDDDSELYK